MSDEKIVFHEDGSYERGGERVEELDVQTQKTKKRSLADIATGASTTVKPARAQSAAPGTFNLDALRASAVKASTTVAEVPLPEPGETEFKKVKTVSAPSVRKGQEATKEVVTPPIFKDTVAVKPEVVEEPKPVMEAWNQDKSAELAKEAAALLAPAETTVPEVTHSEEVKREKVSPLDLSSLRSKESAVSEIVKVETPAVKSDESSGKLEEVQVSEPPVLTTAPIIPVSAKADTSTGGFVVVTLKKFLESVGVDDYSFAKWCRTCVVKAASMPGSIFCAAFNEQVRFYNFFMGKSPQWFGAVVGCGDNIVCVQIQQKSLVMQDDSARMVSSGEQITLNGDVMALYNERLREARKV